MILFSDNCNEENKLVKIMGSNDKIIGASTTPFFVKL